MALCWWPPLFYGTPCTCSESTIFENKELNPDRTILRTSRRSAGSTSI